MPIKLDHLVLAAADLETGRIYIKDRLGVDVPTGGQHLQMGTHNRLMSLGGGIYFEIIAIDPGQPNPGRARWFGLDDPAARAKISARPRLVSWVAGTDDISTAAEQCSGDLGSILSMQRGEYSWKLTVRSDGLPPGGGVLPALIEWPGDHPHPSVSLEDLGCRFWGLTLSTPEPDQLRRDLTSMGWMDWSSVKIEESAEPALRAEIMVSGRRWTLD